MSCADASENLVLRVEWCKSRARQDRWREEVELLQEEMRRVQESLVHQATAWRERTTDVASWCLPKVPADPLFDAGRIAFARGQQEQFTLMAAHCSTLWANVAGYVQSEGRCDIVPHSKMREDDGEDEEIPVHTSVESHHVL
jgi:hypothetical protein